MPSLEESDLLNDLVCWEKYGDSRNGGIVVLYPVQLSCRWVTRYQQQTDPNGIVISWDTDIAVCPEIPIGSIVWEGQLSEIPGTTDPPTPTSDLFEVVALKGRAKDIKGICTRREYRLKRYKNTLPTVIDPLT